MEKKGVTLSVAIIGYLVLGLLLGQCSAIDNPECYANCLNRCRNSKGLLGIFTCGTICVAQCAASSPSLHTVRKDNHYFCKLGCSASLCTSFLDTENPETEKVGGCMDSCSDTCATMNTLNLPPNNN